MRDTNFEMLIEMCGSIGWDKGIKTLKDQIQILENKQAYLINGSFAEVERAIRLSQIIVKQNLIISDLKIYKQEIIDKREHELK